jgi:hypothetical protein
MEMSLSKKSDHAFNGERGLSSLRSTDAERTDSAAVDAAESSAPVVEASWDPYQVWLTRVKQPREHSARLRKRERQVDHAPVSADTSDTARLRALPSVS